MTTDLAKRSTNGSGAPPGATSPPSEESTLSANKAVFGVAAAMMTLFVAYGALRRRRSRPRRPLLGWLTSNFGWLFVLASAMFVLLPGYLRVTRYGNISWDRTTPSRSSPRSRGCR